MSFDPIQKIFILAGESSGDYIGSSVMRGLKEFNKNNIYFFGVGGPLMQEQGLETIYEMNQFRNLAIGLNKYHGQFYNSSSEVLYNQINYYPPGTGKMFSHKDTKDENILLSCMFNITQKFTHFEEGVTKGGASALLAASVFHFAEFSIKEVKKFLADKKIPVRRN